ncbi:hypothetical protein EVAR_103987_1 [Eumeta japonica]|uniref:Uncharacterized protein n=1 Tax=Eumeta variegata TaxID=151549 RepID=A0A4C1Y0H7_EUMVA|nr:hypothetical protein EVAR_103987_1 [Eumeta japonica]
MFAHITGRVARARRGGVHPTVNTRRVRGPARGAAPPRAEPSRLRSGGREDIERSPARTTIVYAAVLTALAIERIRRFDSSEMSFYELSFRAVREPAESWGIMVHSLANRGRRAIAALMVALLTTKPPLPTAFDPAIRSANRRVNDCDKRWLVY